jgi:histidine phosphotransferase ChpT
MKTNQALNPNSDMPITDIRLLELMASKICHDLISPVGAISNGVEILEELGPDAGDDVTGLIAFSATQAAAKLKALRLAYGQGGSDSSIKPEEVHRAFGDFIKGDGRVTQDWNPHGPLGIPEPITGFSKILMCGLLLTIEALPKGGKISVTDGGLHTTIIKGEGENAGFREGFREALELAADIQSLAPKHVHACMTGLLSQHYGFSVSIDQSPDHTIILKILSPVV